MGTPSPSRCTLCGCESEHTRRRIWFNDWTTVLIFRAKPVEVEALCPMCYAKERRKAIISLGVVGLALIVALVLVMNELGKGR